ncbi:hypothetical protein AB6A40_007735 [Gnathostoma spinigerum]|uniref:Major facilitator superfamily (MFS) profile domain-containing protein n=1 Tax=Gnathostoma spinigerum TaxID=75299 RepID=A0ABD6EU99_9BILA
MFNFEKIAGSIFVNTGMMGGLRWSVNIIMAIIDIRFFCAGRRLLHCVCMFFMAFLTMCITVIMMTGHAANFNQAMRVMALMNAATCTEVYVLNAVAPSELFPTPIRNSGISFIQVFNRVGNIVSPFLFTLADFWEPLPYVVMCGTCLIDAILYLLFIPETKGKELPDQMPGEEAAVDEKVAKGSKESKESRSSKSATSTTSEEE